MMNNQFETRKNNETRIQKLVLLECWIYHINSNVIHRYSSGGSPLNLEDKLSRLKDLYRIKFPTEQQLFEIAMLEDDVKLIMDELKEVRPQIEPPKEEPKQQKQYRGIISGRIQRWRDERRERNKATPEKIRQLNLEAQKAELEARIAEAKARKKGSKPGLAALFGPPQQSNTKQTKSKPTGKSMSSKEFDDKMVRRVIGSNDKDYDSLW